MRCWISESEIETGKYNKLQDKNNSICVAPCLKILQLISHETILVLFSLAFLLVPVLAVAVDTTGPTSNSDFQMLPKTGQTTCYDAAGNVLSSCTSTGQDGEFQTGQAWPTPRFSNTDGTTPVSGSIVLDNLTGLEWTRDGGTPTFAGATSTCAGGVMSWQSALDYVKCLNTNHYLGHNDWRLPNINELASILNRSQADSAAWLNGQGFQNMQWDFYWSSTTTEYTTSNAWLVVMSDSRVVSYQSYKTNNSNVLPVRGGQFGSFGISGILMNWGAPYTNNATVTLALDASDPSGVTEMQFRNEVTGQWTTPEPYSRLKSWALNASDGPKTIFVRFRDAAGNWSVAYSTTIEDRSLVKIRRGASDVSHHQEIAEAYALSQSGDTLMLRGVSFAEDLLLNQGSHITLSAGWNDIFTDVTGQTGVKSLNIGAGSVVIEGKVVVR